MIRPLRTSIGAKKLTTQANHVLQGIGDVKVILPDHVLIPILGGGLAPAVPGPAEPLYGPRQRANIQGNTIPGFNKDHQHFLFFRLGRLASGKAWLQWIAPQITSLDEVLAFVRAHRALRFRLGVQEVDLCATWVNIAFSHHAIAQLAGVHDADAFGDQSFRQWLGERSTYLGDPTRRQHRGHRSRWVVGGPRNEADILVIVAADDPEDLVEKVAEIKRRAAAARLRLLFEQRGDTLPGALRGHEHFGFKDGVSQPGVRGKVSTAPGDFITPRYLVAADSQDNRPDIFAKPGQLLLWPGQFLLGEPRQHTEVIVPSAPGATNFPAWAALGSYLVCRRLRQDVPAFWRFAIGAATALGIPPLQFGAMLVGRWPSGAPIMRTPAADNAALAGDPWANNQFIFDDDTRPSNLIPIPGYTGDGFARAHGDFLGAVCPHFAHIRKTNPRDGGTDLGKPADTTDRMILRRGIPFGRPIAGVRRPPPSLVNRERGLMFVCYGSTIEDQFEFLTRRWANSPIQPDFDGHDPIIGAHDVRGNRTRFIDVPTPAGARRIQIRRDFVIPTGGGYFFSPPIEAIAGVLGA